MGAKRRRVDQGRLVPCLLQAEDRGLRDAFIQRVAGVGPFPHPAVQDRHVAEAEIPEQGGSPYRPQVVVGDYEYGGRAHREEILMGQRHLPQRQ